MVKGVLLAFLYFFQCLTFDFFGCVFFKLVGFVSFPGRLHGGELVEVEVALGTVTVFGLVFDDNSRVIGRVD